MKITVQHINNSFSRSYELKSPGATFGRSHENQIVLPDPSVSISLFQAAIKLNEAQQIVIRNLAATPILIGNHSLRVGQSFTLQNNSEFVCGDFKFQLEPTRVGDLDTSDTTKTSTKADHLPQVKTAEEPALRVPTVMPMPGTNLISLMQVSAPSSPIDAQPNQAVATQEKNDETQRLNANVAEAEESHLTTTVEPAASTPSVFDDLFAGNGVVPIGAEPHTMDMHPFEINSATSRNTSDPLEHVNGIELDADLSKDPLERLSRDGIEHQQRDIFYDTRPSALLYDNQDGGKNTHLDDLDKIFNELESYAKVK